MNEAVVSMYVASLPQEKPCLLSYPCLNCLEHISVSRVFVFSRLVFVAMSCTVFVLCAFVSVFSLSSSCFVGSSLLKQHGESTFSSVVIVIFSTLSCHLVQSISRSSPFSPHFGEGFQFLMCVLFEGFFSALLMSVSRKTELWSVLMNVFSSTLQLLALAVSDVKTESSGVQTEIAQYLVFVPLFSCVHSFLWCCCRHPSVLRYQPVLVHGSSFLISCRRVAVWDGISHLKASEWPARFAFASSPIRTSCFGNFHQIVSDTFRVAVNVEVA